MRLITFVAPLLASALSFSIPAITPADINYPNVLRAHFPGPETDLYSAIAYMSVVDRKKFYPIIAKHKNFKDFKDVLADLRRADPEIVGKIEPAYGKNREAYLQLTGDARAFMEQYFAELWSNAVASLQDSKIQWLITNEQGPALKQKFDALTAEQKEAIQSRFPMLYHYVKAGVYRSEGRHY